MPGTYKDRMTGGKKDATGFWSVLKGRKCCKIMSPILNDFKPITENTAPAKMWFV